MGINHTICRIETGLLNHARRDSTVPVVVAASPVLLYSCLDAPDQKHVLVVAALEVVVP
jgi:hypothetical protein